LTDKMAKGPERALYAIHTLKLFYYSFVWYKERVSAVLSKEECKGGANANRSTAGQMVQEPPNQVHHYFCSRLTTSCQCNRCTSLATQPRRSAGGVSLFILCRRLLQTFEH